MLEVKDLSFCYHKGQEALHGVSLSLEKGQIGVLLGQNGSGKSTLLQCVAGLLRPQQGTISYEGEDLLSLKPRDRARKIAYVPQDPHFSSLSVYEAILMGRLPHMGLRPTKEDQEEARKAMEEMGLTEMALRNVSELSGGEQQSVLLARALAQGASLLLFDEPTSSLDLARTRLTLSLLRKAVKEGGRSALVSLHDVNLALELGDHFFLLKEGKLLHEGDETILNEKTIEETYGVKAEILEAKGRRIVMFH